MTGTCGKCNKDIEYRQISPSKSIWVHTQNGNHISYMPERHDCNTYIRKDAK